MARAGSPAANATASQGSISASATMLPTGGMTAATAMTPPADPAPASAVPPIRRLTSSPSPKRFGSRRPTSNTCLARRCLIHWVPAAVLRPTASWPAAEHATISPISAAQPASQRPAGPSSPCGPADRVAVRSTTSTVCPATAGNATSATAPVIDAIASSAAQ